MAAVFEGGFGGGEAKTGGATDDKDAGAGELVDIFHLVGHGCFAK